MPKDPIFTMKMKESYENFLTRRIKDSSWGELNLSSCSLTELPVKDFKGIQTMNLSSNYLRNLDSTFDTVCHRLDYLDLSHNQLTSLPEDIGETLLNLSHLDFRDNLIVKLPLSIGKMRLLKWVDARENPLCEPLVIVCGDCKNVQQCNQCAKNLVYFMNEVEKTLYSPVVTTVEYNSEENLMKASASEEDENDEEIPSSPLKHGRWSMKLAKVVLYFAAFGISLQTLIAIIMEPSYMEDFFMLLQLPEACSLYHPLNNALHNFILKTNYRPLLRKAVQPNLSWFSRFTKMLSNIF